MLTYLNSVFSFKVWSLAKEGLPYPRSQCCCCLVLTSLFSRLGYTSFCPTDPFCLFLSQHSEVYQLLQVYQSSVLSHQNRSSLQPRVPVRPMTRLDPSRASGAWKLCTTHTLKVTSVCPVLPDSGPRRCSAEKVSPHLSSPHTFLLESLLLSSPPASLLLNQGWLGKKMMMESAQQRHVGRLRGSELRVGLGGGG